MASVLREGGSHPIQVDSWETAVKSTILNKIYDHHGNGLYREINSWFDEELSWIKKKWGHQLTEPETVRLIQEMIRDGWVEVSEFKCVCCAAQNHAPEEILNHAVRLKLTPLGYSKVQESIFP